MLYIHLSLRSCIAFHSHRIDMTIKDYVVEMDRGVLHQSGTTSRPSRPWYVFKGHTIPTVADDPMTSLVLYEDCVTPQTLQHAFELLSHKQPVHPSKPVISNIFKKSRLLFVNAQWALGNAGSGAPVHFHNTAWNALLYGAKKWVMYPPAHRVMSNEQILDVLEGVSAKLLQQEKIDAALPPGVGQPGGIFTQPIYIFQHIVPPMPTVDNAEGAPITHYPAKQIRIELPTKIKPISCTQTAGDVMIVPESWSHGVLNVQQSVAIATGTSILVPNPNPNIYMFYNIC